MGNPSYWPPEGVLWGDFPVMQQLRLLIPSFHQIITDRIEYKTDSLGLTKSLAIASLTIDLQSEFDQEPGYSLSLTYRLTVLI